MPPKFFKAQVFALSGKLAQSHKEHEELIRKFGGEMSSSITGSTTYLISNEEDVKACSTKVAGASGRGIPILRETFLEACVKAKKLVAHGPFVVRTKRKSTAKAKPKAKVARTGAGPADPIGTTEKVEVLAKSGLTVKAQVVHEVISKGFIKASITWDAELVLHDIAAGKDKFYNMQLLASKKGNEFWAVQQWGRTGYDGTCHVDGPYDNIAEAKKVFKRKYRGKTGNNWGLGGSFVEVADKYKHLAREEEPAEGAPAREAPGKWQYYLHNKVDGKKLAWYDYDAGAALNMEKYWRQFARDASLNVRLIQSDYFKYEVDFSAMVQRNIRSGMRRVIRRLAADEAPSADKPENIPEPAAPAPDWKAAPSSDEEDDEDMDEEEDDEDAAEEAAEDEGDAPAPEEEDAKMEVEEEPKPAGRAPPPAADTDEAPPARAPPPAADDDAPPARAPPPAADDEKTEDEAPAPPGRAPPPEVDPAEAETVVADAPPARGS